MWAAAYLRGLAYERLVNRFRWLARFRILLIATFYKPAQGAPKRHMASLAA